MKNLAAFLVLILILISGTAGASTYVVNEDGEANFQYSVKGITLAQGDDDTYLIYGSTGMMIELNISTYGTYGAVRLRIVNDTGVIVSEDIGGSYHTYFTIENNEQYRIVLSANDTVTYDLTISSDSNMESALKVLEYTAFSCGVCLVVIIALIVAVTMLFRRKKRPPEYAPQQPEPVPYQYSGETLDIPDDSPYDMR